MQRWCRSNKQRDEFKITNVLVSYLSINVKITIVIPIVVNDLFIFVHTWWLCSSACHICSDIFITEHTQQTTIYGSNGLWVAHFVLIFSGWSSSIPLWIMSSIILMWRCPRSWTSVWAPRNTSVSRGGNPYCSISSSNVRCFASGHREMLGLWLRHLSFRGRRCL